MRPLLLLSFALPLVAGARPPELTRQELAAVNVAFTAERDAAADYMATQPVVISRMAANCRKLLKQPPSPLGEPEESRWQTDNYRFSAAAVRYLGKKRKDSDDPLVRFKRSLDRARTVQGKAYAEADAVLSAAPDKEQACRSFFADSEAGRLNVAAGHPHQEALEGLARELVDARPQAAP